VSHFLTHDLNGILSSYGYFAVFGFVLIETSGIPFPGETMLILASAFAGSTHKLSIYWIIAAAAVAAIIGDNIGYWIGRTGGYKFLRKYGHVIHVDESSMKIGLYLFKCYGSGIVFFARWIPLLRIWGALLAGAHQFEWKRFIVYNAAGGILWATFYGVIAYFFGDLLRQAEGAITYAGFGLAAIIIVGFWFVERRNREHWKQRAEAAFPGPLR
jgi:membrane protein DedA with SNARE-associated domain